MEERKVKDEGGRERTEKGLIGRFWRKEVGCLDKSFRVFFLTSTPLSRVPRVQ